MYRHYQNLMLTVQKRAWKPHTGQSEDLSMSSEKVLLLRIRTEQMAVTALATQNTRLSTYNQVFRGRTKKTTKHR